jgi:hypothetical protein
MRKNTNKFIDFQAILILTNCDFMKKLTSLILVIMLSGLLPEQITNACTNFLITKGASKDGSVMITYSADSHVLYGELYYWPAKNWPAGTMVDIYEWDTGKYLGKIPQEI